MKIKSFFLTSGFYALTEVIARAIQALSMFWVAARCEKETFGEIGLLISIQQAVTTLTLGGIIEALIGLFAKHHLSGTLPSLFNNVRILFFSSSAIVITFYICGTYLFISHHFEGISFVVLLLTALSGTWLASFKLSTTIEQLQEHHIQAILLKTVPVIFCYTGGAVLTVIEADKNNFFLGMTIGLTIAQILLTPFYKRKIDTFNSTISYETIKTLVINSTPFLAIAALAWLSGYGINIFINWLFSTGEVAEYVMVLSLNNGLLLVVNSINSVWSPKFFRIAASYPRDQLRSINAFVNQIILYAVGLIAGFLLLIYSNLIDFAGGKLMAYKEIHSYLAISFSLYIILTIYYASLNYYLLEQLGTLYMRITFTTNIFGLILWFILTYLLGKWGIYISLFVTTVLRAGTVYFYANKKWNVTVNWYDILLGLLLVESGYFLSIMIENILLKIAIFFLITVLISYSYYYRNSIEIKEYLAF